MSSIWVDAEDGDDDGDGTISSPFRTFVRAMQAHRLSLSRTSVQREIVLRHGGYTLDEAGMLLFRQGMVTAAGDGLVFINGFRVQVKRKRQPALKGRRRG